MMSEYEFEPVRGLPAKLPRDEAILWQGSPDWRSVARSVLHIRVVGLWFAGVAATAFIAGGTGPVGALVTLAVGLLGCGLLFGIAWAQARTTVYTLTAKRIVMRFGVALPKAVNVPLSLIGSADAKPVGDHYDIALKIVGRFPLAYVQMWPHVRPGRFADPQPMLRGMSRSMLDLLATTLAAADPSRSRVTTEVTSAVAAAATPAPAMGVAA